MRNDTKRIRSARRGAVLVEAATATLFLLVPLLVGIIQFGLFYSATNALSQATREGGRYAAVYGLAGTKNPDTPPGGTAVNVTDDYIKDRIIASGAAGNIVIESNDITIVPERAGRTQYQPVTVTVSYDLNKKSIFPLFRPGKVTRTSFSMAE